MTKCYFLTDKRNVQVISSDPLYMTCLMNKDTILTILSDY